MTRWIGIVTEEKGLVKFLVSFDLRRSQIQEFQGFVDEDGRPEDGFNKANDAGNKRGGVLEKINRGSDDA